jgi:hypothetical protein
MQQSLPVCYLRVFFQKEISTFEEPMEPETAEKKILTRPIQFAIGVLIIGVLFRIMRLPGGNELMCAAFVTIVALYFIRFINKRNKRTSDYIKLVFVISWSWSGIFTVSHWPGKLIFQIAAGLSFIALLAIGELEFGWGASAEGNDEKKMNRSISNLLRIAASGLILVGALFKIMHWPGSAIMLIGGCALVVIWFLKDSLFDRD